MNRETLRLIVTAAFVFSVLILYTRWVEFTEPQQQPSQAQPERAERAAPQTAVPEASAPEAGYIPEVTQDLSSSAGSDDVPAVSPGTVAPADEDVVDSGPATFTTLANDALLVSFDSSGSLQRLELQRHTYEQGGEQLALFLDSIDRRFIPQTGLIGDGLPNHTDESWAVAETNEDERRIVSRWSGDGIEVDRIIELEQEGYIVNYTYVMRNNTGQSVPAHAYFQFRRDDKEPPGLTAGVPSFYGAAVYTDDDKYSKYDFDDFEDYPQRSSNGWIGIVQRYFMALWLDGGSNRENFMRNHSNGDVSVGIIRPLGDIAPQSSVTLSQAMFAGALEQELLKGTDPELGENLDLAVDYGWLKLLCAPLFSLLSWLNKLVSNWGVSIILLTLLIKLAFFPLSAKSYRSMARMKNVAPQMQKLKERYGDDRQELQRATLELYRKEKINPLGGCLPILIQIPVFIALYWMLLESVELRHAPFVLWVQDLSNPDPFFVLPVLLGLSMVGQFKLNPTPPDPTQAMIMKIMPIGFAAFSIIMPSGLVIYWISNTILSIAQQWQINRTIVKPAKQGN